MGRRFQPGGRPGRIGETRWKRRDFAVWAVMLDCAGRPGNSARRHSASVSGVRPSSSQFTPSPSRASPSPPLPHCVGARKSQAGAPALSLGSSPPRSGGEVARAKRETVRGRPAADRSAVLPLPRPSRIPPRLPARDALRLLRQIIQRAADRLETAMRRGPHRADRRAMAGGGAGGRPVRAGGKGNDRIVVPQQPDARHGARLHIAPADAEAFERIEQRKRWR